MNPTHIKTLLIGSALALFSITALGLFWFLFFGPATPVGFGWYLFSFASGLSMIVLPCTLPLAFVIVPLSMGKGAGKGLMIALMFGAGVALMLSMYGIIAAVVGEVAIGSLGAPLETVKNWLYFIAGAFAYLFALGEIGLIRFRIPTYTGSAPAFIQKQQDYFKALFLGLFLGNIGVGCPHPATPVILTRIAASGDVFYGWLLFFVHALGRVVPLLFLAILAIAGVNALVWLVARKDKVERATGWGMVFVAAFILVLGLFSHDWWVNSGQHTFLEELTQEERLLGIVSSRLNVAPPHQHELEEGEGLLGLPLSGGNWVLVLLWIVPLWWYYRKKLKIKNYKLQSGDEDAKVEKRIMPYRFWLSATISLLLILVFVYVLPMRFLMHAGITDVNTDTGPMPHAEHEALFHEETEVREGLSVNLNVSPVPVAIGTSTRLDFFVNEKPGNIPLDAFELEFDHTKLMHVVGVRDDLGEFFHIHPVPSSVAGFLSADYGFKKPGFYKIWSEIKKDQQNHVFGHPEISVTGEGATREKKVSFGRNVVAGNYQVALDVDEPVIRGEETHLSFDVHSVVGDEVAVEDFLGAPMHLSIIKDDLKQFIHTHPVRDAKQDHLGVVTRDTGLIPISFSGRSQISNGTRPGGMHGKDHANRFVNSAQAHGGEEIPGTMHDDTSSDETVDFHIVLPEAGLYRAFAQFRPRGIDLPLDDALTAAFWIRVEEQRALNLSGWWVNLLVSAVLIVLLSWGVNRYLNAKL